MSGIREWLTYHSLYRHLAAPLWLRLPERHRWTVVYRLDRSQRRCWSGLVTDALAHPEDDPCDVAVPSLRDERRARCATTCDWSYSDHTGEHACNCYCGKFRFLASEGARDRAGEAS